MAHRKQPLTGDEAKARLRAKGMTTTEWAAKHGYIRRDVYRVLNGQLKANFGTCHQIAVDLGMKIPFDEHESSAATGERNTQSRRAA